MSERSPENSSGKGNQYNRVEAPQDSQIQYYYHHDTLDPEAAEKAFVAGSVQHEPAEGLKKKKKSFIWYIVAGVSLMVIGAAVALVLSRSGKNAAPTDPVERESREVSASITQTAENSTQSGSKTASPETTPAQTSELVADDRITIVVPYAAGGVTDQLARALQGALEKELDSDILVLNQTDYEKWDVYKMVLYSVNGNMIGFADYPGLVKEYLDPENKADETFEDYTNIADVFHDPSVIVVREDSPFNSLKDLIDAGKEMDLKISVTGGWGYDDNVLVRLINKACGTQFTMLEGDSSTARSALFEGVADAQATNISDFCRSNDSDKLKVLAVFDDKESVLLPDAVPVDDTGIEELKGLYVSRDIGLIGNSNMSQETAGKIAAAVAKIGTDKSFLKAAVDFGYSVRILTGEDFNEYIKDVETKLRRAAVWSSWQDSLPDAVTEEKCNIETREVYRSSTLKTMTSTATDKMDGWELYDSKVTDTEYGAWSDWSRTKPDEKSGREIESAKNYRYSDKETTTSSSSSLSGWTLEGTSSQWSEYGAWSDWNSTEVTGSDSREVETQKRYRYRDRETTSSYSPALSGWTQYGSGLVWGDWGDWYYSESWVEDLGEAREIEPVSQYRSRDSWSVKTYSPEEGGDAIYYTEEEYGDWGDWQDSPIYGSESLDVETREVHTGTWYYLAHYCVGYVSETTKYQTYHSDHSTSEEFNENCVYHELGWVKSLDDFYIYHDSPSGHYGYRHNGDDYWCSNSCFCWYVLDTQEIYTTQYRCRSKATAYYYWQYSDWSDWSESYPSGASVVEERTVYWYRDRSADTVYYFERWGDWSDWSATAVSASDDREVQTSKRYRYRDRASVPVYHFSRWKDWSAWSATEVSQTDSRRVETATVYRYRDKGKTTTYYFRRWSDWSKYTKTPITESETVKVQKKTQYRWKIKSKRAGN